MHVRTLKYLTLVLMAAAALLVPASTSAHGGHTGPRQTFTQAVGPYEVAITIELPEAVPAQMYIDIAPPDDIGAATITVRAAPRGQSFANAPVVTVQTIPGPQGFYYTDIPVDRAGDWELEVHVDGPQGAGVAHIPFSIVIAPLPPYTLPLLAALGGLIVLMTISLLLAGISRSRGTTIPRWANWLVGQGMFACLIVAAIFGAQQITSVVQSAQAAATGDATSGGRPHVNMVARTDPALPEAGQPMTLTLELTDGGTGLPVDDLVAHHEALMHLVVVDDSGQFFAHVHPPRVGPGRYAIELTPDRPGRYVAYAELERQDSGTQVIARDFEVAGSPGPTAPAAPGLGEREVDGLQVKVSASNAPLKAGKQTTLTFSIAADGVPANDLQPWLGMAGHLIARSADGAIFGHIHAQGPMAPSGVVGSGMRYGPDIRFVYTFPQPGRYQLWGQFKRGGQIVTIPLEVEVEP